MIKKLVKPRLQHGLYSGVKLLPEEHELNQIDAKGQTLLHHAVAKRDDKALHQLLKAGADPGIKNWKNRTVLEHAIHCLNLNAMMILGGEHFKEKASEEICCSVITRKEFRLQDFKPQQRSEKCCFSAIQYDDKAWLHIPRQYKKTEVLIKWLQRQPDIINALPDSQKTNEFIERVLQTNPSVLKVMAKPWQENWIDIVLKQDSYFFDLLDEQQKTYSRSLALVSEAGYMLRYVPEHHKDNRLCLAAIANEPCLDLVPEPLLNDEYYSLALSTGRAFNGESLALLPAALRSYDLCYQSVIRDYQGLKSLPDEFKTRKLFLAILDGREFMGFELNFIFSFIPEAILDDVRAKAQYIRHIQPEEM